MQTLLEIQSDLLRLKWQVAAMWFQLALRKHAIALKAGFNPDQPRDELGRWTEAGGGEEGDEASDETLADTFVDGGPPLDPPPEVPEQRPPTSRETNAFLKAAAQWIARAIRLGAPAGHFVSAYQAASWLDTDRAYIEAYQDPPRSLAELQEAVGNPTWGYHIHHIVEQGPARKERISEELIESWENKVRIPALKHWQITGWYGRPNREFGGASPRDYLRDKSWEEKMQVGRRALIEHGVPKR